MNYCYELNLRGNKISNLNFLSNAKNMKHIDLSQNNIHFGESLFNIKSQFLETLNIQDNPCTNSHIT